jgi:hypothetical protein
MDAETHRPGLNDPDSPTTPKLKETVMIRARPFHRMPSLVIAIAAGIATPVAVAADPIDTTQRKNVDMPPNVPPVLRGEMVGFLGTMQQAVMLSSEGKFVEASDLVENEMGFSAMGRHAGGVRPGMFMPPEMHSMARFMHKASTGWSQALRIGDRARADAAFAQVLGTCAGCHATFQLRVR